MKNLLFILTVLLYNQCLSQNNINIVLSIDDRVVNSSSVNNMVLIFSNDTIPLEYESGRIIIDKENYQKLNDYNNDKKIVLKFDYFQSCPKDKIFTYSLNLKSVLLKQRYFNINLYNFENYPRLFKNDFEYDFEYTSPIISKSLPKKKRKHILLLCR